MYIHTNKCNKKVESLQGTGYFQPGEASQTEIRMTSVLSQDFYGMQICSSSLSSPRKTL